MQCEKFEARLHQLLDLRLPPATDARLQAHALHCQRCRQVLAVQQQLLEGLELADIPDPSDDFPQRVLAQLHPASLRRARWPVAVGLVATLAATLLLALFRAGQRPPTAPADPVVRNGRQQQADTNQPAPQALANLPTGPAWSSPPGGSSPAAAESTAPKVREVLRGLAEKLATDAAAEQLDTVGHIAKPITTSFAVTLDALRRTIPLGRGKRSVKREV